METQSAQRSFDGTTPAYRRAKVLITADERAAPRPREYLAYARLLLKNVLGGISVEIEFLKHKLFICI